MKPILGGEGANEGLKANKGGENVNKVVLIGRLTRDIELRYTNTGRAVANFTLAVDRGYGEEKETDFITVVVWQKTAENCAKYVGKGSQVAVDGRIQVRPWEDKEGNKRWAVEVVASRVKFLDKLKDRGNGGGQEGVGEEVVFPAEDDIPF